ncbi:MAG: hypothetical protein Q8L26_09365 [Candidatus Omnitrophota bacterium]|nr:hypothetical protein [Candidatus Omnitrophota bacterium]
MKKHYIIATGIMFFLFISALASGLPAEDAAKGFIWVLDDRGSGNIDVVKVAIDEKRELFRKKGFKESQDLDVYSKDGSIWVIDTGNNQVVNLSSDGQTELARLSGFASPFHGALCQKEGFYWVADQDHYEVVKISTEDKKEKIRIGGFTNPHGIKVSPFDNTVWVSDAAGGKIIKLSQDGKILGQLSDVGRPWHLAIDSSDGSSWVSLQAGGEEAQESGLIKVSADCKTILAKNNDIGSLSDFAVNPVDGSCWVITKKDGLLINIAKDAKTVLIKINKFHGAKSISKINPLDGSFWVGIRASAENEGRVVKLSASGEELASIGGFNNPILLKIKE